MSQPWKVSRAVFDEGTGEVGYFLHGITEVRAADRRLIENAHRMRDIILELRHCADYWCEYEVPLGIVERMDAVINEVGEGEGAE
ncbi:MAG: hypothetical protein EOM03_16155 [Clostridia bacterium]|nr:hypothetical protein [Clostridia bacterium]